MKKIIALVLAVISLTTIILFAGCSKNEQAFAQKSYDADGTKIEEINIDVRDRQIDVSVSADNQIRIAYSESDKEYYDITVSDDNVLTMTFVQNKEWSDFIGKKATDENRKITLEIPDALLKSLKLSTTNEDIKLTALNISDITLSSNGGNISFEKIDAKSSITLTAKNGNISGSVVGGYDDYAILCDIKKGESNLPSEKANGEKKLSVNANNGDVNIDFVK